MKERLTGAIILVALIVLLVPELLTGPIRMKSAPVAASLASSEVHGSVRAAHAQPPLRSYTLTLGTASPGQEAAATPAAPVQAQPAENAAPTATGSPSASPAPSSPESASAGDQPQHATPPQDPASNADSPRLPPQGTRADSGLQAAQSPAHPAMREARSSASSTGWVVQLGSFASRQNADRLARSLEGRGFRMSVSPARAGARELWRVRAGPVHDRTGAQRLAARLRALGHRGELLPVR